MFDAKSLQFFSNCKLIKTANDFLIRKRQIKLRNQFYFKSTVRNQIAKNSETCSFFCLFNSSSTITNSNGDVTMNLQNIVFCNFVSDT